MFQLKQLFIEQNTNQRLEWESFLNQAEIRAEASVDAVYGVYDEARLVGTGALYRNILKCVVVCEAYQGGIVLNQLISHLMDMVWQRGYTSCYVYTKPSVVQAFNYLGFKELTRVGTTLVFLEKSVHGLESYLEYLSKHTRSIDAAAIVMNANPFTLGHQYLIEKAAEMNACVYVFVVSEDTSEFPASVRKALVTQGVSHLKNVVVLDTQNYIVSAQTFPSYFLKEESDVTRIHATLDATLFHNRIAPVLSIKKRYVGEEPYSVATAIYNNVLKEILEPDIAVEIVKRKEVDHKIISATFVREALQDNNLEAVKAVVPQTTYQYLVSNEGQALIQKIRTGGTESDKV